jgi:hypothetical protein
MRGDQLARQWRVFRAIEASPNGLTVTEIAKREDTGIRTIYRDLDALQAAGFPLYTEKAEPANRWAFRETSKFRPFPPFTLTKPSSLFPYRDLNPSSIHSSVNGLEVGPASPNRGPE